MLLFFIKTPYRYLIKKTIPDFNFDNLIVPKKYAVLQ